MRNTKRLIALVLVFAMVFSTLAFADVTKYIATSTAGTVYEYDYAALKASYTNSVLGLSGAELYNHYKAHKTTAVYDSSTGKYVDFAKMREAYTAAVLAGNAASFNMNAYASSSSAVLAAMPATVKAVTVEGGAIKETDKPTGTTPTPTEITVASTSITSVEVNFGTALTALPAAAAFQIAGLQVKSTAFKAGSSNKVVVLETTDQSNQNYTLQYDGKNYTFIGISLNSIVLMTAAKYEVEINPAANQLTPVEITAQLQGFPQGAEAAIEFDTTFGKVSKQETTQNGKATFQLTPLETIVSQTARVTGKVVEVKNPATGQTFPEYKNSPVQTVNVKFIIKDDTNTTPIQSFKVDRAYATQADRINIRIPKEVNAIVDPILAYEPNKLIASETNPVKKEFYRHLQDVLFSNIKDTVVKNRGAVGASQIDKTDVEKVQTELKKLFKDITVTDLRNILYADTIGQTVVDKNGVAVADRYATVYAYLYPTTTTVAQDKAALKDEITNLSAETLQGILNYYKLVSKFIILDNIKDTAAPQNADDLYAVEMVYKEATVDNSTILTLVLPSERRTDSKDYTASVRGKELASFDGHEIRIQPDTDYYEYEQLQREFTEADRMIDNASHQVVFANNAEVDRYEFTGDPTFKLEDSDNVDLIAVYTPETDMTLDACKDSRYLVGGLDGSSNYSCPLPVAYKNNDDGLGNGGVITVPTYDGTLKLTALNYAPTDCYERYDELKTVKDINNKDVVDKLGELKVVFSESLMLSEKNDRKVDNQVDNGVLNPANWSIDGFNLKSDVVDKGYPVHIRMISTDPTKQLRDAVIITFRSNINGVAAPNEAVELFVENTMKATHKLQVKSIGDWAADTDDVNIVATQELDYNGIKAAAVSTPSDAKLEAFANGNAFVVRAAEQQDIATGIVLSDVKYAKYYDANKNEVRDAIRVLFSEPMNTEGEQSVLNRRNFRLDGIELPVEDTEILQGIRGVAELENSPCGITIVLKDNYLQSEKQMLTISNVRGVDDTIALDARIQLPYARQYTVSGVAKTKVETAIAIQVPTKITTGQPTQKGAYTVYEPTVTMIAGKTAVLNSLKATTAIAEGVVYRDEQNPSQPLEITEAMGMNPEFFTKHIGVFAVANVAAVKAAMPAKLGADVAGEQYPVIADGSALPTSTNSNVKLVWYSNNLNVKVVDNKLVLDGSLNQIVKLIAVISEGSTTETKEYEVKVAKSGAPVVTPVTGVTLNKATLTLAKAANETLVATVAPADANNKNVTWTSSNTAVATVDATGKVTAVAAGKATITVTTADGAKTAACVVTVTDGTATQPAEVESFVSVLDAITGNTVVTVTIKAADKDAVTGLTVKGVAAIQNPTNKATWRATLTGNVTVAGTDIAVSKTPVSTTVDAIDEAKTFAKVDMFSLTSIRVTTKAGVNIKSVVAGTETIPVTATAGVYQLNESTKTYKAGDKITITVTTTDDKTDTFEVTVGTL